VNPGVKFGLLAGLAALAGLYFALFVWRAHTLAGVLLHRGWAERGWTEPRLALGLRILGLAGVALAIVAVVMAMSRAIG
jgi:hypothetical protein